MSETAILDHKVMVMAWKNICNLDFHKLEEIGNNTNIGIKAFTTWKQK